MKNHEGYRDPTAGLAVKKAVRMQSKGKSTRLFYRLDEVEAFREVARCVLKR